MTNTIAKAAQKFPQSGGLVRVSQRGVLALMLGTVALPVSGAWAQQVLSGAQTTTQSPTVATGLPLVVTTTSGFSVDTTGNGGGGTGIYLFSYGGISFTDTNQAAITGYGLGISAMNKDQAVHGVYPRNSVTITSTGVVTGTQDSNRREGNGIEVSNEYGGDLTITVASVMAEGNGTAIFASGFGNTGALTITATGAVGVLTPLENAQGIFATNQGTDLTISAATVSNGISARSKGSGAVLVEATGDVTGGIQATNYQHGTSLTIDAAKVSGTIAAKQYGSGALAITASGDVSAQPGNGIFAANMIYQGSTATPTSLTITATSVSGSYTGIFAANSGTGALSITATGAVTGINNDGIYAYGEGTDLTIAATSVSGGTFGINALNYDGTGELTITTTGAVTGATSIGIYGGNGFSGTDLTISAAAVTGGTTGIAATNYGSGELSVTATGAVTGTTDDGIAADGYGTDLTISAASVSGGSAGIYAKNFGTGALDITASGAVTGTSANGIYAYNKGTSLTISAAAVTGGDKGISAKNLGTGGLSVTATGAVTGTGIIGAGIFAYNKGTSLTISAASASGTRYGIFAMNDGNGPSTITVSGDVSATGVNGMGMGIANVSNTGDADTITLLSTARVNGIYAIVDTAGDTNVTISSGALVTGAIWLGAGDDTLTIGSGTTLSGVTLMIGDAGTDTLNISSGWSGSLNDWEVINADTSGGDFALNGFSLGSRNLSKTGDGTLTLNGALTLAYGSRLSMGVPQSATDPLIFATGAATIAGDLIVTPGQTLTFGQDYVLIEASARTGEFDYVSISGGYTTTLTYTATSVLLRFDPDSLMALGGATLTPNALALATAFDAAVDGGFDPAAFATLYTQADTLNAKLGELSGELHSAERRVALADTSVVREAALDRLGYGLTGGADATAATGGGGAFWMRDFASWGTADADGTGSRATTDQAGFLMGADFVQGNVKYGGMFSYTNTNVDLGSLGYSKTNSTGAALYAGYRQDGAGLAFAAGGAFASTSATGERSISITGLEQTLTSTVQGTSYQIFGEVSNDMAKAGNVQIEPFARLAYAWAHSDAFAETGGSAALSGAKQSNDLRMATLGLRGAYVAGDTTLSGSAAWLRSAGDLSAPTTLSMAGVDTPYEVNSAALDEDAVELAAQASVDLAPDMTLAGGYTGTIGKNNATHGVRVTLSVAW